MKEKFEQFVARVKAGEFNTGHIPDVVEVNDPTNYAQCMDLAYAWCDTLGVSRDTIRSYYAYQVWTQPKDITVEKFEMIPNTPTGLPQVGDLVVFSNRIGVAGHIAIATGMGDTNNITTFDQNWGTPKTCRYVSHNFDAVFGWLRLRTPAVAVITDQTILPIKDENGNYMEVQSVRSKLTDMTTRIANLENECNDRVNSAISLTKEEMNSFWQPQLTSANAEIERLKLLGVDALDWRTLMSIAWKKFWASKRG